MGFKRRIEGALVAMDKYSILLGYFDKQIPLINKLYQEVVNVDVSKYKEQLVFAFRTQQFYTAIEDLFKQIAKSFENHIENMSNFHKELLVRINMEIPNVRPSVISKPSLLLLDKIRSFRHFVRHAYDVELDKKELELIQNRLKSEFRHVEKDLNHFRAYLQELSSS